MKPQLQPTRYSCGPTCVAMLADVTVQEVLVLLSTTRDVDREPWLHSTTVAELAKLLRHFGFRLGIELEQPTSQGIHVIKIRTYGQGWHWALWEGGIVFDPMVTSPCILTDYDATVTFFEVVK